MVDRGVRLVDHLESVDESLEGCGAVHTKLDKGEVAGILWEGNLNGVGSSGMKLECSEEAQEADQKMEESARMTYVQEDLRPGIEDGVADAEMETAGSQKLGGEFEPTIGSDGRVEASRIIPACGPLLSLDYIARLQD